MSPDAQFTHAHMVRFERPLPAPREKVWDVLTNTARLPGWYGDGAIDGQVGGEGRQWGNDKSRRRHGALPVGARCAADHGSEKRER